VRTILLVFPVRRKPRLPAGLVWVPFNNDKTRSSLTHESFFFWVVEYHVCLFFALSPFSLLISTASAGWKHVRMDLTWAQIQHSAVPRFDFAPWDMLLESLKPFGIKPILILDYGNPICDGGNAPVTPDCVARFVNFTRAAMRHFQVRLREGRKGGREVFSVSFLVILCGLTREDFFQRGRE
jgi:hypothetical protein